MTGYRYEELTIAGSLNSKGVTFDRQRDDLHVAGIAGSEEGNRKPRKAEAVPPAKHPEGALSCPIHLHLSVLISD